MGEMLGKLMKDPAMREIMASQQKTMVNMMYSGLFKDLNLTPEEKEKFTQLLTDSQMKTIEAAQGMFGNSADTDATGKAVADAKKQADSEIKALLGDDRFAQYQDYQKTMTERMQLDSLQKQLASENMPLATEQSAQLMQILKEEKTAVPPVIPTDNSSVPNKELMTAENIDKQLAWMNDYNRRVSERAKGVLTPEQYKQYVTFQEQQASMQKLGLNMARQMFGGKQGGATPAAK
jgi:hypothetical protein